MIGVELVKDKASQESFEPAVGIADRVFKHCLQRGVIVRPVGNVIVLSPPLILDTQQVDTIISALVESIRETTDDLRRQGLMAA